MSKFLKVVTAIKAIIPTVKIALGYAKAVNSAAEYKGKDKVEKALNGAAVATEVVSVVVDKVKPK